MDFVSYINTAESAMPDNIETATALEIKRPCSVSDAYQILVNYPNLKQIKVAGETYTRQTIGQMPIDGRLGGQILEPIQNLTAPQRPDPVPAIDPFWEPSITRIQAARARFAYTYNTMPIPETTFRHMNDAGVIITEEDTYF